MPIKDKAKQIEPSQRRLRSEGSLAGVSSEAGTDYETFQQVILAARRVSAAEECQAAHSAIDNINTSLTASEEALEELAHSSIEWRTLTSELEKLDSNTNKSQVGKVKALTEEYEARSRSNSLENLTDMEFTKDLPVVSPTRPEGSLEGARGIPRDSSNVTDFAAAQELAKEILSPAKLQFLAKSAEVAARDLAKETVIQRALLMDEDEGEEDSTESDTSTEVDQDEEFERSLAIRTAQAKKEAIEKKQKKEAAMEAERKEQVDSLRDIMLGSKGGARTKHPTTLPHEHTKEKVASEDPSLLKHAERELRELTGGAPTYEWGAMGGIPTHSVASIHGPSGGDGMTPVITPPRGKTGSKGTKEVESSPKPKEKTPIIETRRVDSGITTGLPTSRGEDDRYYLPRRLHGEDVRTHEVETLAAEAFRLPASGG